MSETAKTNMKNAHKRWFSTGFMGGGVSGVDADKHTLKDAVMVRPGEALGHGLWIDKEFCADIAARSGGFAEKGLKARFGHPNMCSEALGTFLGRWKILRLSEDGKVTGDLFLSSTAAESPKGDLRKYVEEMAAKEPDHFGASVVFTRDEDAELAFWNANQIETEEKDEQGNVTSRKRSFKSPDPKNTGNLPHARCAQLHAADLVDDPAATDGMFSGLGGASLAAEMTEWLDLHPQVLAALNSDPALLDIVERYADQLKPFLARYTANQSRTEKTAAESATPAQPAVPAEPSKEALQIVALQEQFSVMKAECERLVTELAESKKHETALSGEKGVLADQLSAEVKAKATAITERDNALSRIQAFEKAGVVPVSTVVGEKGNKTLVDPWKQAQRK